MTHVPQKTDPADQPINNLCVLVFPKVNKNEIKDLQTDTIYSKSVIDLEYGAKMQVLNNLFATSDYEGDVILHPTSSGDSIGLLALDTPFKLRVTDPSDVSALGFELLPLKTSLSSDDNIVVSP